MSRTVADQFADTLVAAGVKRVYSGSAAMASKDSLSKIAPAALALHGMNPDSPVT
jgi:hypothetical protein